MQPLNHPKSGIISFIVALAVGLMGFAVFVGMFIPESGTYAAQKYNNFILIFILIIAPVLHFVGIIFGIIGAFAKNTKKLFSIFGIILNSIGLLLSAGLWILILLIGVAVISSGGGWV